MEKSCVKILEMNFAEIADFFKNFFADIFVKIPAGKTDCGNFFVEKSELIKKNQKIIFEFKNTKIKIILQKMDKIFNLQFKNGAENFSQQNLSLQNFWHNLKISPQQKNHFLDFSNAEIWEFFFAAIENLQNKF